MCNARIAVNASLKNKMLDVTLFCITRRIVALLSPKRVLIIAAV